MEPKVGDKLWWVEKTSLGAVTLRKARVTRKNRGDSWLCAEIAAPSHTKSIHSAVRPHEYYRGTWEKDYLSQSEHRFYPHIRAAMEYFQEMACRPNSNYRKDLAKWIMQDASPEVIIDIVTRHAPAGLTELDPQEV